MEFSEKLFIPHLLNLQKDKAKVSSFITQSFFIFIYIIYNKKKKKQKKDFKIKIRTFFIS